MALWTHFIPIDTEVSEDSTPYGNAKDRMVLNVVASV